MAALLSMRTSGGVPALRQSFHTSPISHRLQKLTRLRVVDNSELGKQAMMEGKPPKIIHVYNRTGIGTVGKKFRCLNFSYLINQNHELNVLCIIS